MKAEITSLSSLNEMLEKLGLPPTSIKETEKKEGGIIPLFL